VPKSGPPQLSNAELAALARTRPVDPAERCIHTSKSVRRDQCSICFGAKARRVKASPVELPPNALRSRREATAHEATPLAAVERPKRERRARIATQKETAS